jgi:hypothetical protein
MDGPLLVAGSYPAELLQPVDGPLDGLNTNGKFCVSRAAVLRLTWWRRALRQR